MNKQFLKDALAWGFAVWLIGYALGMILVALVPASVIGWIIMPIGTAITLWIACKKVKGDTLQYYSWPNPSVGLPPQDPETFRF
jgi:hypothetical protein